MQNREHYSVAEQLSSAIRRLRFSRSKPLAIEVSLPPLSENAKFILARAEGSDLQTISPLGALQLAIKRLNEEAKNESVFKKKIAKKLFSKRASSEEEIEQLWAKSSERVLVNELFTVIRMQQKLKHPVTFRDACNLVYQSKTQEQRFLLDKVAKILLLDQN